MRIEQAANKQEALSVSSQKLNQLLQKYHDTPLLFLSSGGSAFLLLESIPAKLLSANTTIGVLDERYSIDPAVNNFAQLQQTSFYTTARQQGCFFIDTTVMNGESGETHAIRFEDALKDWKQTHPNGVVIATAGMGPDGHTSGIMPFPENQEQFDGLFNNERWVVHYNASGKNPFPLRTTTTLTFLKTAIDHTLFFISGNDKKEAFTRMTAPEGSFAETPARIAHEMKDVIVVTDIT